MPNPPIVSSTSGIELARKLAEQGQRIFTIEQAQALAPDVGVEKNYLNEALHHLTQSGWIVRIMKGLYALSSSVPGVTPVHEFEIAMAIVEPAAISHWSALHYHGLTEQIPQTVFALTPTTSIPDKKKFGDITYKYICVKPERYFGTHKIWLGDARIIITDPERTLLDGLMKPQYCGDFAEVLHAFEVRMPEIKLDQIIDYALKLDTVVAKRLGWVLEHNGVEFSKLEKLATLPINGYRPLDPTRPKKGDCNRRWSIQENFIGKMNK